jgi:hypothetical protein
MQVLSPGKGVIQLLSRRSPCLHFTGWRFEVQLDVSPDDSRGLLDPSPVSRYFQQRHGHCIVHVFQHLLRRIHFIPPGPAEGDTMCVPYPALDGPCTLQLATEFGETGCHPPSIL